MSKLTSILVLCTGNSARSILAEALLSRRGAGRLIAYSAGSNPRGEPHPAALRLLAREGYDITTFRSKSWLEFCEPGAPAIDTVITVCGNAAGEACPIFPGQAIRTHWGLPDPADITDDPAAQDAAFAETWRLLDLRVAALLALDSTLEETSLQEALNGIGQMEGAA